MNNKSAVFALAALLTGTLSGVQAAPVTLCGETICYEYDSTQADIATLGTPTVIGDTVRFLPTSFSAIASGASSASTVAASFVFNRVYSTLGEQITGFSLTESGDYRIWNGGQVGASTVITAWDNNSPTMAMSAENFASSGDSGGLQLYGFDTTLDTPASTDISLTIQHTVMASTNGLDQLAFLQQKLVLGTVTTATAVSEPRTVAVLALGFGMLLLALRRRSARHTTHGA